MSISVKMMFRTIVKPFYRQYAALFTFLVFIMFFAVGRANGVGMLEYHLALMKGILRNSSFLMLVLFGWLLYALTCQQFVSRKIGSRENRFLFQLTRLPSSRIFALMSLVHVMLFLPLLVYALVLVWIGFNLHLPGSAIIIVAYLPFLCALSVLRSSFLLHHPGIRNSTGGMQLRWIGRRVPYWNLIIRFILAERKLLFAGIKLYSAGTLYFLVDKADLSNKTDLQLIYLFYGFGLLGHGVLIHQLRNMEDERLGFYRSLPVSLINRWIQYAWIYFIVFIPEWVIILRHLASFPQYNDAFMMAFFGYGMLLLLNSLLYIQYFKMTDYLKIVTGIFFLLYISILTGILAWFSIAVFLVGITVFFSNYYRYERRV